MPAPVAKPTEVPRFATGSPGVYDVEPPETSADPTVTTKDTGMIPGSRTPAQYPNWLFRRIYLWILWLKDINNQPFTASGVGAWSQRNDFAPGADAPTNTTAATFQGKGTAWGIMVGGNAGAVYAESGGNSQAVYGLSHGTSPAAVFETDSGGNVAGCKATGSDGGGPGFHGYGGSSGGYGCHGTGTAANPGGYFEGDSGAPGCQGEGGSGGGSGGYFNGHGGGHGAICNGNGVGAGAVLSGGNGGDGAQCFGTGVGSGLYAQSGASGGVAVNVNRGHLQCTGTPPAGTADPGKNNLLHADLIPKAWGLIKISAPTAAAYPNSTNLTFAGVNVATVTYRNSNSIKVTFARAMADTDFAVTIGKILVSSGNTAFDLTVQPVSTTEFWISTGPDANTNFEVAALNGSISFHVFGRQAT